MGYLRVALLVAGALALCMHPSFRHVFPVLSRPRPHPTVVAACKNISQTISNASAVFYPGSREYNDGNTHWSGLNQANPVCVVFAGNATDVAIIVSLLGKQRVPFNVRGGGHCANPKCSSTDGVLLAMARFNDIQVDEATGVIQLGAGLVWGDVHAALEGTNLGVIGGSLEAETVGVAGYILGGGYGWASNEHGIAIDRLEQVELVSPQGDVIIVNELSYPEAFWALKGGFNNLGIVTRFWVHSYPAPEQVWGGVKYYAEKEYDALFGACSSFDLYASARKASVLCSYMFINPGITLLAGSVFYNGPDPPSGLFTNFSAPEPLLDSVLEPILGSVAGSWHARSMSDLSKANRAKSFKGRRILFHMAAVRSVTPALISAIKDIGQRYSDEVRPHLGAVISLIVAPLSNGIYDNARPSAFPHASDSVLRPIEVGLIWDKAASDGYFHDLAKRIKADIVAAAIADGQDLSRETLYPNIALGDTPLELIYGSNVARLQAIAAAWDPDKVMTLAGGFKFQSASDPKARLPGGAREL